MTKPGSWDDFFKGEGVDLRPVDLTELLTQPAITVIETIRNGIPFEDVDRYLQKNGIGIATLAEALHVSKNSLRRRSDFKNDIANRVVRFIRVFEHAKETTGSTEGALRWLQTRNPTIYGFPDYVIPLTILDTDCGTEAVTHSLLRIQHGMFA